MTTVATPTPSFPQTRWSMIALAASDDPELGRAALATLCEAYWKPLYAFARRRGHSPAQAEDLVQGFFARFLAKNYLAGLDPGAGHFRGYLLAALKNHIAGEATRARAKKRGGGVTVFSLDVEAAERDYAAQLSDQATPEDAYYRAWALTLLARCRERLRQEQVAAGKRARFEALVGTLRGEQTCTYAEIARRLGISQTAAKVAAHRLRQRYGELLREELARTVDDVDAELRALIEAVGWRKRDV
jgi:RNA polymerase sigma-70 factor (ECF subfamily)